MSTNSNFMLKLKTFAELAISIGLFYVALTYPINFIISLFVILVGIFVLFQAIDNIDKINHYGPYNQNQNDSSDNNPYINQNKHQRFPQNDYHNHPPFSTYDKNINPYAHDNDVLQNDNYSNQQPQQDDNNNNPYQDEESSLIDLSDFIEE